ncbi:TniQ family protein (plasmid) [Azospirillum sp. A26]|uniref:TniQ family protein n=1 Tax=Azospirillum sp. A26 TaxID=3160607 RepID=UPI003672A042
MEIEDIPPAVVAPLRWPIRPPIQPNELLSSWISRLALANGLSPASLHEDLDNLTGPTSRADSDHSGS